MFTKSSQLTRCLHEAAQRLLSHAAETATPDDGVRHRVAQRQRGIQPV